MKFLNLYSFIVKPNKDLAVPSEINEINYNLFYENINEKKLIEDVSVVTNVSKQTLKIIYNIYFNKVFDLVTTSEKREIYLGRYFKFINFKNN